MLEIPNLTHSIVSLSQHSYQLKINKQYHLVYNTYTSSSGGLRAGITSLIWRHIHHPHHQFHLFYHLFLHLSHGRNFYMQPSNQKNGDTSQYLNHNSNVLEFIITMYYYSL